jgi:hypothetical protein
VFLTIQDYRPQFKWKCKILLTLIVTPWTYFCDGLSRYEIQIKEQYKGTVHGQARVKTNAKFSHNHVTTTSGSYYVTHHEKEYI